MNVAEHTILTSCARHGIRDQPHFDLLGLQLQLQSDDEREPHTN
jgi:hypothetical protein